MSQRFTIQQWFQPQQPSIRQGIEDDVRYEEVSPDPRLRQFIHCYWQLQTKERLTDHFSYRVVSDGCVDILFEMSQPERNFITGLSEAYLEYPLSEQFHYIGIRFLPTGFSSLFKISAAELTNRFEDLDQVLPQFSRQLADVFLANSDWATQQEGLNLLFLEQMLRAAPDYDLRVFDAIAEILQKQGQLSIRELNTGLSPRQLRRLFHFHIGTSPKTFSKIVRFQQLLLAKPSIKSLSANKLFFDAGYYDQAHFIKEFKHFYGLSPTQVDQ